ncbi:MAG: hypothetical protein E6946_09640, partial [Veillonella sp.]
FKPAEIYIEEHITEVWACKKCEAEADKANIISATTPKTLLHWSYVNIWDTKSQIFLCCTSS